MENKNEKKIICEKMQFIEIYIEKLKEDNRVRKVFIENLNKEYKLLELKLKKMENKNEKKIIYEKMKFIEIHIETFKKDDKLREIFLKKLNKEYKLLELKLKK